jgi:putative ABC transport system permease protein
MKLGRNIALSVEILAAHKLRTSLSILGVVVGVASVILMVAAGQGAEQNILNRIRGMGTDLVAVNAGQVQIIAGRQRQMSTVTTLVPADAQAIVERCPAVSRAAAVQTGKTTVHWQDQTANTTVYGMGLEGLEIRNVALDRGRSFSDAEERALMRVALMGPTAARNVFQDADPLGQSIRVGRVPFEVIGLTRAKGIDVNGVDQDDLIVIPLRTALRRVFNVPHVQTIYARARDTESLIRAEEEIRAVLRDRHRLGGKPDDFTIQNQATLLAAERETSRSITLLIGSVAGISLLVGGVGIFAVMLISIRERTGEIGLRRALGARRRDIRLQFLFEAALLAGSGGMVGVVLGAGSASVVSALASWPTLISWPAAIGAFLFSALVGLFFGLYPATRAARLEPIEALRSE